MRYLIIAFCCFWAVPLWGQNIVNQRSVEDTLHLQAGFGPYEILYSLEIDPEGVLILDPGVELRFHEGAYLLIEGTLQAIGTQFDPIVMGAYYPRQDASWAGIEVMGEQAKVNLQFATVLLAQNGLMIQHEGARIQVENSVFAYCDRGVSLLAAPDSVIFERNTFTQNGIGAWFAEGGDFAGIRYNEWCNNTNFEIYLAQADTLFLGHNCWCKLEQDEAWKKQQIYRPFWYPNGGEIVFNSLQSFHPFCWSPNNSADFFKGGGDVTVVLDDLVATPLEDDWDESFLFFPHPLRSTSQFILPASWNGILSLTAYDIRGRLLWEKAFMPDTEIVLHRSQFPLTGLYRVIVTDVDGRQLHLSLLVE